MAAVDTKTQTESKETPKAILGYWKIRGLAHHIRMLLEYTETPFDNKYYVCGEAPNFNKEEWTKDKHSLGFQFPNLPYYIEGSLKLTQSNAIIHYIGSKHKLCGSTPEEIAIVEMMIGHAYDLREELSSLNYGNASKYEENKKAFYEGTFSRYVKDFEDNLAKNTWMAGSFLSLADFVIYELMDVGRIAYPSIFEKSPRIQAYLSRFEKLPKIAEYFQSDRYFKRPCNNPQAGFR